MQNSHGNSIRNSRGKKRKRRFASYLESDTGLLAVFIASAFIVSISTLVVPWTLESQADNLPTPAQFQHHSVTTQLKKESGSAKQPSKKDLVDSNSSSIRIKRGNSEGYFLTHSAPYHTIFSTGCSIFQDWQSYVFFYHVFRSGQEGHVTRIASGCSYSDRLKLQDMFKEEIKSIRNDTHHLHLTPDYSRIPKKQERAFKYFNKPYGVRHWMEHALGYPENHELHDDSIIILMDPDQIMLRPFTNDFSNSSELWRSENFRKLKIEHGSPFSQQYGYGLQWLDKVKPENVFHGSNWPTPVSNLTREDARHYFYSMGPVSEIALLRNTSERTLSNFVGRGIAGQSVVVPDFSQHFSIFIKHFSTISALYR
jgi:hypothetical protein